MATNETSPVDKQEVPADIAEDVRLAKIAQARKRGMAPEAIIQEAFEIDQKRLIKQYVPNAVGPKATEFAMFGDRNLLRQYIEQDGYEPVSDRGRRIIYGREGDVLLKMPKDLHDRMLKGVVLRSERMLQDKQIEESQHVRSNKASGGERVRMAKSGDKDFEEIEKDR